MYTICNFLRKAKTGGAPTPEPNQATKENVRANACMRSILNQCADLQDLVSKLKECEYGPDMLDMWRQLLAKKDEAGNAWLCLTGC